MAKLAMIVYNPGIQYLFISAIVNDIVDTVASEAAAEKFVKKNFPSCVLIGCFDDPSKYLKAIYKELNSEAGEDSKIRKRKSRP